MARLRHGAADDWIRIERLRRRDGQAHNVAAGGEARRLGRVLCWVLCDDVRHASWIVFRVAQVLEPGFLQFFDVTFRGDPDWEVILTPKPSFPGKRIP